MGSVIESEVLHSDTRRHAADLERGAEACGPPRMRRAMSPGLRAGRVAELVIVHQELRAGRHEDQVRGRGSVGRGMVRGNISSGGLEGG